MSFNTGINTTIPVPKLISPEAGSSQPLKPIFQWEPVAGTEKYELVVSTDFAFGNPTILKVNEYALPSTAWQSSIHLEPDTTYYWKVRAAGSTEWSPVSAFTTELLQEEETAVTAPIPVDETPEPPKESGPEPPPNQQSEPQPASTPTAPEMFSQWSLVIIGGLLLALILLLVVLLVVVLSGRRSAV